MCRSWAILVALSLFWFVGGAHSLLDSEPVHSPVTYQVGSLQDLASLTIPTGKKQEDMVGFKTEDFNPTQEPEMMPSPLPLNVALSVVPESSVLDEAAGSGEKAVPKNDRKECVEENFSNQQNEKVSLLELTKPVKDKMSKGTGTSREGAVGSVKDSQGASDHLTTTGPQENEQKAVPKNGNEDYLEKEGPSSVPRKGVDTVLPELGVENPPSVPRKGVGTAPDGQSVPRKGVDFIPSIVEQEKGVGKRPEPQELVGTDLKSTSVPRKGVDSLSVPRKGVESQSVPRKGVETVSSSSIPYKGVGKGSEIPSSESSVNVSTEKGISHTSSVNRTDVEAHTTLHTNNSFAHNSTLTSTPMTGNFTQSTLSQAGTGVSEVEPHLNETAVLSNAHTKPPTSDEAFLKLPSGDGIGSGNSFSLQIFGIVSLCVILIGGIIGYKRLQDVWLRRHYSRVDFLVDGMYIS